jgi:hypothetical protein
MRLTNVTTSAIVFGLTILAAPAFGQAVGMQVVDTTGAPVGTVAAIQGDNLQIKTDKHEALVPKSSVTLDNGKLLFGMTQAQLDSEIEKNLAAANAAIAAGATVKGVGGEQVGTIESVADGKATIALQDGKKIAVPQEGLRGNADGSVTIGYSAAQLEAMVQGAATATDANSSAAAPPANTPGK